MDGAGRVDDLVEQLGRLGIARYESKAYIALVHAGRPLNGYEVAKLSGVPRSTVYETLSKLVSRAFASEIITDGSPTSYFAMPPAMLFGRLRDQTDDAIEKLRPMFAKITASPAVHFTQTLRTRADVLDRCLDLTASAQKEIISFLWPEEVQTLGPALTRAHRKKIQVGVMHFGSELIGVGDSMQHTSGDPEEVMAQLGCRLMVLVSDREQAVVAGLLDDEAWGIHTDDPSTVALATEFIVFDMFVQHVFGKLGREKIAELSVDAPSAKYLSAGPRVATLLRRLGGDAVPGRDPKVG
jgi:sugar-specific transcriptional regulator TrmB